MPYFHMIIYYVLSRFLYRGMQNVLGGGGGTKEIRARKENGNKPKALNLVRVNQSYPFVAMSSVGYILFAPRPNECVVLPRALQWHVFEVGEFYIMERSTKIQKQSHGPDLKKSEFEQNWTQIFQHTSTGLLIIVTQNSWFSETMLYGNNSSLMIKL